MVSRRITTPGFRDPRYRALIGKLAAERRRLGITQEELARRLGLHKQFVSRFELGERRLDVAEFADVAVALELNPAKLIAELW